MQTLHLRSPGNFALKAKYALQAWIRKEIIDFDPYEEAAYKNQSFIDPRLKYVKNSITSRQNH